MSATQIQSSVLVLTTDPDRLAKLQRKHEEYSKRYLFLAPEVEPSGTYRLLLLGELLEKRLVDLGAFEAQQREKGGFHQGAFTEALAIIEAYNSGDHSKIRGGTGLR